MYINLCTAYIYNNRCKLLLKDMVVCVHLYNARNFFNKALTIKKDFKIKLDKKSVTSKKQITLYLLHKEYFLILFHQAPWRAFLLMSLLYLANFRAIL